MTSEKNYKADGVEEEWEKESQSLLHQGMTSEGTIFFANEINRLDAHFPLSLLLRDILTFFYLLSACWPHIYSDKSRCYPFPVIHLLFQAV
uniref:hypothetical protein n=1 Tax=Candidatus Electronema sp. TaxID=2698783 RepID=UPI0040574D40